MTVIAVVKETKPGERRVALSPEVAKKLKALGVSVRFESGAAQGLGWADAAFEVGEIGNDQIHAEQIGFREHRAGVDDDGRLPTRDGHHVEAELAEAAKRHDIDWGHAGSSRVLGHTHAKSQQDVDDTSAEKLSGRSRTREG